MQFEAQKYKLKYKEKRRKDRNRREGDEEKRVHLPSIKKINYVRFDVAQSLKIKLIHFSSTLVTVYFHGSQRLI